MSTMSLIEAAKLASEMLREISRGGSYSTGVYLDRLGDIETAIIENDTELAMRAAAVVAKAKAALGNDLGGFSVIDLLLDNFPELSTSRAARILANKLEPPLKKIGFTDAEIADFGSRP